MPEYVCKDCGKSFKSKEDLGRHKRSGNCDPTNKAKTEQSNSFESTDLNKSLTQKVGGYFRNIKNKQSLLILIVAIMFVGSTFALAFTRGSGGQGFSEEYNRSRDTTPPTGVGLKALPKVKEDNLPSAISGEEISEEVQVYLIAPAERKQVETQRAVLLQYNCERCSQLISNLSQVVQDINGDSRWVYLAPYNKMNSTIALTTFEEIKKMETFDKNKIEDFICTNLDDSPLACSLDN